MKWSSIQGQMSIGFQIPCIIHGITDGKAIDRLDLE